MLLGPDRRGFSEFRFLDMCGARLGVWLSSRSEGLHWRGAFSGHRVFNEQCGLEVILSDG